MKKKLAPWLLLALGVAVFPVLIAHAIKPMLTAAVQYQGVDGGGFQAGLQDMQPGTYVDNATKALHFVAANVDKTVLLSGGGGGSSTLATDYTNGASQTDSTILLDSTRLGVFLRDNATPISGSLFSVQSSGGTKSFLDVTPGLLSMSYARASGTSNVIGLDLENTSAAANGAQQFSPMIALGGRGWSIGGSASQAVQWVAQVQPLQASGSPSSWLNIMASTNGGAYTLIARFLSTTGGMATSSIGPTVGQLHTLPAVTADTVALLAAAQEFTTKTITAQIVKNGLTATGSTANDFSGSTGAFATSSGTGTLSGNTSMASAKLFTIQPRGLAIASTTAPTCSINANAGSTATCNAIVGSDSAFKLLVTSGGSGGATGTWFTVNFNGTWAHTPICIPTANKAGASSAYEWGFDYTGSDTTHAKFSLTYGTDFAPGAVTFSAICVDPGV